MKNVNFGIEVEMTGLPREVAAQTIADYFGSSVENTSYRLDERSIKDNEGRSWKIVSDSSITPKRHKSYEGSYYNLDSFKVELVSPICTYKDIKTIQEIVRNLRKNGAIVTKNCGIHIHINASNHTAKTLKNIVNIIASKEELLYKSLNVDINREYYCKKMNLEFLDDMNKRQITSKEQIERLWYKRGGDRNRHYDNSRYHALNLHSVFNKGTIEFRLFNSTLHAGEIKSYVQLCLAISHQALVQKRASPIKTTSSNEKYTFRTWLLRLGFIGDEYKTARLHLLKNLEGNIAWKDEEKAKQSRKIAAEAVDTQNNPPTEHEENHEGGMNMSF